MLYGADEAPSCTKQAAAFDGSLDEFKSLGVTVCGVRNEGGVKGDFSEAYGQKFVVDEGDMVREEIGIAKDLFGLLGGRETYVLDGKGEVKFVFAGSSTRMTTRRRRWRPRRTPSRREDPLEGFKFSSPLSVNLLPLSDDTPPPRERG